MGLNSKGDNQARYKEEIFNTEGSETLAQVSHRGGRCPVPGPIPGQLAPGALGPRSGCGCPCSLQGCGLGGV